MCFELRTPSLDGNLFSARLDKANQRISITSAHGTPFHYNLSAIRDLYLWLRNDRKGDWTMLGTRGEEETPHAGTVEEWARAPWNPIGGWYGLTPGRRGRFASFIPPILELLALVELEHNPNNNRMRAL